VEPVMVRYGRAFPKSSISVDCTMVKSTSAAHYEAKYFEFDLFWVSRLLGLCFLFFFYLRTRVRNKTSWIRWKRKSESDLASTLAPPLPTLLTFPCLSKSKTGLHSSRYLRC
jgi:hypothetical protein